MDITRMIAAGLFATCFVMHTPTAHADTIQLTSAGQLSSNDTYLAIVSSKQQPGYVSPENSISFSTGDQLTFSRSAGQFEVDQAGVTYGQTAFANNTYLVGAGGFQGSGSGGPITITFATPVVQFGLNIEDFNATAGYLIGFQAFDASGSSLGSFSSAGFATPAGTDGSLSFEGLTATSGSIAKVVFDDNGLGNNLIFGNVEFAPVGTSLEAPSAVTPEPSSILLLGSGLLGMTGLIRKRFA